MITAQPAHDVLAFFCEHAPANLHIAIAMQMAVLAIQGSPGGPDSPDLARFIQVFVGSNRYVMDYLLEEVLQRLPAGDQAFLLKTSILEKLCGPLCEAVAGLAEGAGQAILERLERANLFVMPLMTGARGTVITACSPTCWRASSGKVTASRSPSFTGAPAPGSRARI